MMPAKSAVETNPTCEKRPLDGAQYGQNVAKTTKCAITVGDGPCNISDTPHQNSRNLAQGLPGANCDRPDQSGPVPDSPPATRPARTLCSSCHRHPPRSYHPWCAECHRLNMKIYRAERQNRLLRWRMPCEADIYRIDSIKEQIQSRENLIAKCRARLEERRR
jgi:hypothetical protein